MLKQKRNLPKKLLQEDGWIGRPYVAQNPSLYSPPHTHTRTKEFFPSEPRAMIFGNECLRFSFSGKQAVLAEWQEIGSEMPLSWER